MSLGDLFVQLGVVGDASEIDDVIKKAKTQLELTEKQIKANEKLKGGASKFEKSFKFDKIRQQFAKFQSGFNAGMSGKNGVLGLLRGLGQGLAKVGAGGLSLALGLGVVIGVLAGIVTTTIKAYKTIDRLTESLIQDNQQWVNFANQTDLSLKALQGYSGVASMFDKSLGKQGAAGTIQALNDKLFELQLTGEGARGFQIAGINPVGQDAFGVLEQVRKRIGKLNNTQSAYLLRQIGLDPRLLPMLRMTSAEFERLRKIEERYILTEEQRRNIQELNIQLEIARHKWQYLKDRVILAIMPHFVRLTKNLTFLVEVWVRFIRNIVVFHDWMQKSNTVLGKTITIINKIRDALFTLLHPFIAISKFLYELLDDIEHYVNGGGSEIGVIMYQLDRIKNGFSLDGAVPNWLKLLVNAADKLYSLFGGGKNPIPNIIRPDVTNTDTNKKGGLFGKIPFNPLNPVETANWVVRKMSDNRAVYQYNYINTSESAGEVDNNLRFAMGSMTPIG